MAAVLACAMMVTLARTAMVQSAQLMQGAVYVQAMGTVKRSMEVDTFVSARRVGQERFVTNRFARLVARMECKFAMVTAFHCSALSRARMFASANANQVGCLQIAKSQSAKWRRTTSSPVAGLIKGKSPLTARVSASASAMRQCGLVIRVIKPNAH
jgi:hypothetical protein